MGKPKNKSKGKELVDSDSDLDLVEEGETEEKNKPAGKVSKKERRKKKKDDDWEDDIADELATLSMGANKGREEEIDQNGLDEPVVTKKEKKKKKKGRQEESDEEEQGEEMPAPQGKKKPAASFQMLMMDDDDDEGDKSQSEDEKSEEESQPVQKTEPSKQQKKKEKRKKGGKDKTTEEDDVDALLAEIEKPKEKSGKKSKKDKKREKEAEAMEAEDDENQNEAEVTEVIKVEPKVVTMEDLEEEEEDDRKKRKKKKGKKEEEEAKEGENEEEEEGGTMKTAAQKRKEKKEREKQKKMADKKKQAQKKEEKSEEKKDEQENSEEKLSEPSGATGVTEEHGEEKGSGDEGEEEGGKKKKKKKKGEKEEKEKKKTKKAPVAAIKELLKKQKEEEERLQREEEERIRKEEEAIRLREEQKRLEEERKQKKKEKEKARKERLKQEGKLLTEKQKQDKRRAMQLLESMKEQGLELPQKDDDEEKKPRRPVYHDKKRKKQQQKTDESQEAKQETPSPDETPASTPMAEEAPTIEVEVTDKVGGEEEVKVTEEEVKDTWEEDTKDAWDASSEEEEEDEEDAAPAKEVTKPAPVQETKKVEVSVKEEKEESEEESEEEEEESDEESEEEESEESESSTDEEDLTPYERAENKIMKRHEQFEKKRTTDILRAPVVCVLGHVDTGKTKILDKLRRTNVQDGEAGGITQQIGATNVPEHALREKTTMCKEFQKKELKLPGLLIIDTPGHESFSNLRSRGSSLCDIAILVIDIMHGLEPQTIESINLLKEKKTPFVVALNKIDRLYQWKSNPNSDVVNTIKRQTQMCKQEFDERSRDAITQLAEQGLNAALFYENKNPKEYISMVPTSAHSGDGMGNLVALICELTQNWMAKKLSFSEELQATVMEIWISAHSDDGMGNLMALICELTQNWMAKKLSFSEELQATVMEVKALPGLGTTVDVILVNGTLHEGDHIVIAGTEGPISTQIRGLLMPQPMRELRVKSQYEHHKEVNAAQGVKIIGKDLEKALAGLPMYVAHDDDEIEYYKEEISKALKDILSSIKLSERGVFVQASTLGSLEALLEFLRTEKIPYAGINIGPVHKKDIMKASIMLEHDSQYAVILAFDVKVERDAQEMADNLGVTIFTADIIYHLQDKFTKFREDLKRQKQEEFKHIAVFPCKLRVLPNCIFNSRDPIVIGVSVEAGFVKNGTPICVPSKDFVDLGRVTSLEVNHKPVELARKGQEVCIKIENIPGETPKLYGRHFDHTDMLVSKVSRASIDAVKDYFRDDMTKPDWALMVELKKLFQVL